MSKSQISSSSSQFATLDQRTQRAVGEDMSITPHGTGIYRIRSQSGGTYLVDLPAEEGETPSRSSATCTCPDYESRKQGDSCKHIRRVKLDIAFEGLPRPETPASRNSRVDSGPNSSEPASYSEEVPLATDGGAVESDTIQRNGTDLSPSATAPEVDSDTHDDVYRQIAERISEIEAELNRHQAELKELETALSVFEEYGDK